MAVFLSFLIIIINFYYCNDERTGIKWEGRMVVPAGDKWVWK